MEINEMTWSDIETRTAEIEELLKTDTADVDALESEITALEERKAELKKEIEERKAVVEEVLHEALEVRTFEREERKMTNKEIVNSKEYINAFAEYLKSNDDKECRALLSENVSGGTVAVPELVYDIVKTAWNRDGIMALVKKTYLKGNLKVQFEISGEDAVVHTEGDDPVGEEVLTLGIVQLVPQSIKKWISISDEVYDLRGEEFLNYIYDELTYRIAKAAGVALLNNIISSPTTSSSSRPAVGVVTYDATHPLATFTNALGQLADDATNPVIVINRALWAYFKGLAMEANYGVDPFEGLPVVFCNLLPATVAGSEETPLAIVGDFENGALANFPNGDDIRIKFDDLSLAEADLIKIVGRTYVGLGVIAPNHFVMIAPASGEDGE